MYVINTHIYIYIGCSCKYGHHRFLPGLAGFTGHETSQFQKTLYISVLYICIIYVSLFIQGKAKVATEKTEISPEKKRRNCLLWGFYERHSSFLQDFDL